MAFDKKQFRDLIQRTLENLNMHSEAAVNLLLGTAAQESRFGTYLRQIKGPALGVFQMEPDTEIDIWINYIRYRAEIEAAIGIITGKACPSSISNLEANLSYQIAMARIHYLRVPEALPDADDIEGLARYWKQHYNTHFGAGTEKEFIRNYAKFVGWVEVQNPTYKN